MDACRDIPPFALSLWRTSIFRRRRRPPWSPTRVIPLEAGDMGEGAVRRLITNLIRLLMGHTSTIFPCRTHGPRAIGKEHKLRTIEILWALARFLS